MTNTQAAIIGEALALIHGELVAIRASCERAEARAADTPEAREAKAREAEQGLAADVVGVMRGGCVVEQRAVVAHPTIEHAPSPAASRGKRGRK